MTGFRRIVIVVALLLVPISARAQGTPAANSSGRGGELSLFAEPWAGGIQYLHGTGGALRAGATLTVGPFGGVTMAEGTTGPLREWVTAYPALGLRTRRGLEAVVSPIGAALGVGDDFGAIYPSGQLLVGYAADRLRLGTAVRVIRIAGGNGSGAYRWQWVPVRVGIVLGK